MAAKERNSNLEILRMISMFIIILHHFAMNSPVQIQEQISNKNVIDCMFIGGKIGVNCFVLISAYFLCTSKVTIKKVVVLLGELWFYNWLFLLLYFVGLTPVKEVSITEIIKSVFPLCYSRYWFITTYVILLLLLPFLNRFVQKLEKKQLRNLIGLLIVISSVIPTFLGAIRTWNTVRWFILLYFIAVYIKRYGNQLKKNAYKHFAVAILFALIYFISVVCFNYFGNRFQVNAFLENSRWFAFDWSIIILVISVELFLGFLFIQERSSKIINAIARTTFGVYLIHGNLFLAPWEIFWRFWDESVKKGSVKLVVYMLLAVIIMYTFCIVIDFIRQWSVERVWIYFLNKNLEKIVTKIHNTGSYFWKYVKSFLDWYYQ